MTRVTSARGAVLFIFITVLVDTIGLGIILPVLPELIMELTGEGLSRASIYGGWVWVFFAGIQFFCAPLPGHPSGRFGRRAVMLISAVGLLLWPGRRRPEWRRCLDLGRPTRRGTLLQMRKPPAVIGLAAALFLWQLGHQVLPSTWAFYTMLKFRWSEAAVGASLAFVGTIMAVGQGVLTRVIIPRLGERRTAIAGLVCGSAGYLGYAFATRGWMMYAWMLTWLFAGLVYPSMNANMSRQIPANAQGELQGGVACLFSVSSIVGPPLMTQLFGRFSADQASLRFPGAAFVCAALLTVGSLLLFLQAIRSAGERATVARESILEAVGTRPPASTS